MIEEKAKKIRKIKGPQGFPTQKIEKKDDLEKKNKITNEQPKEKEKEQEQDIDKNKIKAKETEEKTIIKEGNSQDKKEVKNTNETKTKNTPSKSNDSPHCIIISGTFIGIFLILLLIIFGAFSFYNYTKRNVIAKGIYIYGTDVSNLTQEQAISKLNGTFENITSNDLTLIYNEYSSYIKPAEIELSFDINSAVNYAYKIGKDSNIFQDNFNIFNALINGVEITPTASYNKNNLTELLNKISSELPGAVVESGYYIESNELIITKGKTGIVVDIDLTINEIDKKLSDLSYLKDTINLKVKEKAPEKVNLEKIHSEIYKDATDAYYTTSPYSVHPSSNGIDFKISVEEATKIVEESTEEECSIPLKILYPKVSTNDIGTEAFPDKLSSFSTKYVANSDRTTNLRLAANKINGYVLLPGEIFSYNSVVGERTISAGYKEAAVYQNGQVVQGLGGGICQISSTLFNAALFANLEMVELYNHQFVPSYVTAGRDATVVYGVKDFKFKNTRNYPIKITCSVANGTASFELWGLKESTEYEVSVYANITSRTSSYIKSSTYRTLKQDGNVVKTEKITNSTYKVH